MKKQRFIKIGKELVPVSEEIYTEYYKMARRERYFEQDIKKGRLDIDRNSGEQHFVDSKEDSIERLMELGGDFESDENIENIIADKATLTLLQKALESLEEEERELVSDIYYKNQTTRQIAENKNIHQTTIVRAHKKILGKLKKYF